MTADASRRGKRTLLFIAVAVLAPVVLSYAFYHFAPRDSFTNYGELLETTPAPAIGGFRADGSKFSVDAPSGRWIVMTATNGRCDAVCERRLYATRQARTIQGRERERVMRVLLVTNAAGPDPALATEHPDLVVVRTTGEAAALLPRGATAIYLIDPLGNRVLAWPADPDIKAMARDLARVLKASRIG